MHERHAQVAPIVWRREHPRAQRSSERVQIGISRGARFSPKVTRPFTRACNARTTRTSRTHCMAARTSSRAAVQRTRSDRNLSWGAIFAEGDATLYTGVQCTNDTHKSHPLYGGANILARSGPANAFNRVYDTFFQVPELRQMFLRRMRTLMDTWVKPIGTASNSTFIEQMVLANRDLIAEEANRDRAFWGWPAVGGQNNFAQGINITNGVNDMLEQFFRTRRIHFYGKHLVTNTLLPLYNGVISPASNTVAASRSGRHQTLCC